MKPVMIIAAAAFVSLAGGAGAGFFLAPKPELPPAEECDTKPCSSSENKNNADTDANAEVYDTAYSDPDVSYEYVRLSGQFVVPVLDTERVRALVVLSLTIEAKQGLESKIEEREPKLRDTLLQVLFNHAQTGGFDGAFTTGQAMRDLRAALTQASRSVLGPDAHGVLVTDVVKQDL